VVVVVVVFVEVMVVIVIDVGVVVVAESVVDVVEVSDTVAELVEKVFKGVFSELDFPGGSVLNIPGSAC
jgi:hypothetical protein